jgi:twitching motility protein PilT
MARIDSFLRLVAEQKASDLHFAAGHPPIIRHDGDLMPLPFRSMSEREAERFIHEMLIPQEIESLKAHHELDFVYDLAGVARFRVHVFHQSRGLGAVFRIIPGRPPTLEELSLPAAIRNLIKMSQGLVLVCGPTGSGKTTTLAALVHEINTTQKRHVITIEDPIEYLHAPVAGMVTQRQIGMHTESCAAALRSSLREAPDVLVVGEMRDLETISLALSAAETGVLVFGTLHTSSAAKAVDRIIDAFPDDARDQMRGALSVLLKGVVSQRLVKRATGEGRVAAVEVLLQTVAVSNMIRENKIHQIEAYVQLPDNEASGMISLDASLKRLVREGLIAASSALKIAVDREKFKEFASHLQEES